VAVLSIFPGGPPLRFEWQEDLYIVARYWGPERIETGWWRGDDIRRDYYLVETTTSERFWLFRTLPEERWFLHGVFG
jgi:protein ImuB